MLTGLDTKSGGTVRVSEAQYGSIINNEYKLSFPESKYAANNGASYMI